DANCSTSALPDVIDRGLDHAVRGADEVRLLGANRDREALVPLGFGGITENRSRVRILGEIVGAGKRRAERAGDHATDGSQELSALKLLGAKGRHDRSFLRKRTGREV